MRKLLFIALLLTPFLMTAQVPEATLIRLLPPLGQAGQDRILVETLALEKTITSVVFFLDGVEVEKRRMPPFEARIRLASPPRPQQVRVEAYDEKKRLVGQDELTVGQPRRPLRVQILSLEEEEGAVVVKAQLPIPDNVAVTAVHVYLNDQRLVSRDHRPDTPGPFTAQIPRPEPGSGDFVRVVACLEDGREIEDVKVIGQAALMDAVEVRLVQLQVVVTDGDERPIPGLQKQDFLVREGGTTRPVDRVYEADEVALVLGLAVDSSGSMKEIWPQTREAAKAFFYETMGEKDKGFLVDFDADLRLRCGVTDDMRALFEALEETDPEGGTALYDSILFSLLQFERQPGRRGLVVITDGVDTQSLTDPKRTVDFGKKLGVPIYIIALEPSWASRGGPSMGASPAHNLHVLTDPTGGRLYRPPQQKLVLRALAQIKNELRSQYVLTYYTDVPATQEIPEIEVKVQRKGARVKTTWGVDQID